MPDTKPTPIQRPPQFMRPLAYPPPIQQPYSPPMYCPPPRYQPAQRPVRGTVKAWAIITFIVAAVLQFTAVYGADVYSAMLSSVLYLVAFILLCLI